MSFSHLSQTWPGEKEKSRTSSGNQQEEPTADEAVIYVDAGRGINLSDRIAG